MKKYFFFLILNFTIVTLSICLPTCPELVSGVGNLAKNQSKIDSLVFLLKTAHHDTTRLRILNTMANIEKDLALSAHYDDKIESIANKNLAQASNIKHQTTRSELVELSDIYRKYLANAIHRKGVFYYNQGDYDKALECYYKSLKIREELSNSPDKATALAGKKSLIISYNNIGLIYSNQGNYAETLKNYFASLKIQEELVRFNPEFTEGKKGLVKSYNNIGLIYWNLGNYPEALKNYFSSLKIGEEIGDKHGITNSYNNIGAIYFSQGNFPDALKNYFSSLKIAEENNDKFGIEDAYNNIGLVYNSQAKYSEAIKNYLTALKIAEEIGDKYGIATTYNYLGIVYFDQANYSEALKNHSASLKIREEIKDVPGVAMSLINLGDVQTKLHKLKAAQDYLNRALLLCKEIGNKEMIKYSYNSLAAIDSMQGNWKQAYMYHKLFVIYKDSIDNEETKKKTIQSSMTYQFEKKELETKVMQDKKDVVAAAESKKQKIVIWSVALGLLLVLVFTGFVIRSLRITRKQKNIILHQKNEVSHQKELLSEKNKEIMDSINYAQRIQHALLASDIMLNTNLSYASVTSPLSEKVEASYFIFFKPKDVVSGDFYWASSLANGNFAIVTADSTGHGVPGAIMSMLNISCLYEAVKGKQLTEPNEILNYTRSKIIEHLSNDGSAEGGKDGMDCSLISFELPSVTKQDSESNGRLKLTYAAANNPIWIVRENQIIEYKADKMPVGKHSRDTISFTQNTIELQKHDIVYTLTDGFPDQFGGTKGKKFMSKNLKNLLIANSQKPMAKQKQILSDELNSWIGNLEQVDDITVIGIKIQ